MSLEGTWCGVYCKKLEEVASFLPGCSQAYMSARGQGLVLRDGFATIVALITIVCLPFPSPEVRGPGHSTGTQSQPSAATHSAGAPASPCGSRGKYFPHLPLGKLGLGLG